jgi:hypothetical protein
MPAPYYIRQTLREIKTFLPLSVRAVLFPSISLQVTTISFDASSSCAAMIVDSPSAR